MIFIYLIEWFTQYRSSGFNILRGVMAVLTGVSITFILAPLIIRKLTIYKGQPIRNDGPRRHLGKAGTPTMGGLVILVSITFSTLLWADLTNKYIWIVLLTTLAFGFIGFIDDYRKLVCQNSHGLSYQYKYFLQSICGTIAAIILYLSATTPQETQLFIPFFKDVTFDLGFIFIFISYFVIVGSSNAVNLTDGLDGLAIVPSILVASGLMIFTYLSGHIEFSRYLNIPYLPRVSELTIFCAGLIGAGLGFLWFNTYPAQIFMGDVGALSLGAGLGIIAVAVRQEFILVIMGGLFVIETISVIIQIGYFKIYRERFFLMAPLHHHYELTGCPESRVVVRFWIISLILVIIGLTSLSIH